MAAIASGRKPIAAVAAPTKSHRMCAPLLALQFGFAKNAASASAKRWNAASSTKRRD